MQSSMSRNIEFDIMKGIGILLMIIGHLTPFITNVIFSFHMPLFFIISGYFFKPAPVTLRLKNDFKRLILPYLFTCLIIIIFHIAISVIKQEDYFTRWIVASIYGSGTTAHPSKYFSDIPMIGAIWFLLAMFWCRIIYNIIYQESKRTLLICTVISLSAIMIHQLASLPLAIDQGLSALIFYAIRVKAKRVGAPDNIKKTFLVLLIGAWIAAFSVSSLSMVSCTYKCLPLDIFGAVGGTIAVYYLAKAVKKTRYIGKVLTYIGINSLAFLCIHLIDLDAPTFWILGIDYKYRVLYDLLFCFTVVFILSRIKLTQRIYGLR